MVNLIWAMCSGTSLQHGTEVGENFGYAAVNTSCTLTPADPRGALCVLSASSHAPDTGRLDVIAGVGAALTCFAVLVVAAIKAHHRGWTPRRLRWSAAPTEGQTLLLLGWAATLAAVAAASAALFPASPAHVLGRLLAPAWAAALVPVSPRGMLAALGWSFHEAVTAHRVAAAVIGLESPPAAGAELDTAVGQDINPSDTAGMRGDTKRHLATVLTRRALSQLFGSEARDV